MSLRKKIQKTLEEISSGKGKVDICYMIDSRRLVSKRLIPKESSSKSDVVFGEILGKNPYKVSLKIFEIKDNLDKYYTSLLYEISVYRYIIDNILMNKYSPNFVAYLGDSVCTGKTLEKLEVQADFSELNILMTERITDSITWYDFITTNSDNLGIILPVLFQIVYSLAVMRQFRLMHNDLHFKNILVKKLKNPVKMLFSSGKQSWVIQTEYIPYIFDWDRSYTEILGDNPINNKNECLQKNICNRFSDKFDLYTILCTSLIASRKGSKFRKLLKKILRWDEDDSINKLSYQLEDYKLTRQERKNLDNYRPYVHTRDFKSWKFYRRQFLETLPDVSRKLGRDFFRNVGASIIFNVYDLPGEYMLSLEAGHACRPRTFDKNFPTPMKLLHSNLWEIYESKDVEGADHEYTMPKPIPYKRIHISPETESTRHKISGPPRFKPRKSGGHVSPSHIKKIQELRQKYKHS